MTDELIQTVARNIIKWCAESDVPTGISTQALMIASGYMAVNCTTNNDDEICEEYRKCLQDSRTKGLKIRGIA